MTDYLKKSFSLHAPASKKFKAEHDRIFGNKQAKKRQLTDEDRRLYLRAIETPEGREVVAKLYLETCAMVVDKRMRRRKQRAKQSRDHCTACGKPWVEHLGIQPTCRQLGVAQSALRVIYTWATFDGGRGAGHALVPAHVAKLALKGLGME